MADQSLTLPEGYTLRPARHADIPQIDALIAAMDASFDHAVMPYTQEDAETDWADLDLEQDTWTIWDPTGALAAYATLTDEGYGRLLADGYTHPERRGLGLGAALIQLTEARARGLITQAPEGARVVLTNNVLGEDAAAQALLAGQGYTLERVFWRMRIEMTERPAEPEWPEGVRLRPFELERDSHTVYEMVEGAFADHWGHVPVSYEEWARRMRIASVDPSLWFLVEAEDGTLAAVALCRMRPEQGWIRTVATRREWRRHGLASALLRHAFRAFWDRGQPIVGLGVDAQSLTGAARLYEQAGMVVEMRVATFEKELRPGEDLSVRAAQA